MANGLTAEEQIHERIQNAPKQLIATRVKRARKARNLSHDKLGELCGTSRQHLIRLEQGVHRPRAGMLARIAAATGRPVEWFVDPEVDPSPFPGDVDERDGRDA